MRSTLKCHFVLGLPSGSLEIPTIGIPTTLGAHNLCADLQLIWCLKQICNPRWEFFNGMWHATYTQNNWGDSWLLVVGSQIVNLIPNLSFDNTLCFKCPNGSCEPILNIYVSRAFHDIRKSSIQWVLTFIIAL